VGRAYLVPRPRTKDSGSNRDAARGGLERRPSNSGGKAQKIAVRVSERELPKPDLAVISTIPALLDWHLWNESCSENPLMERRRVRHRDLEVHAPTVRIFERCKAKAPARTRRFFQHQVRIVEGEVGESLLFARIQDRKAYEADVKLQRSAQIAHIEFGNEARACQLARPCKREAARKLRSARLC
jgi:hypothetical protein